MRKKIVCILITFLLVLSLAACGNETADKTDIANTGSKGFVMENSTETKRVYIAMYPVDEINTIFQFDVVTADYGVDFPEKMTYALNFVKQENGDYVFSESDQNGDIVGLTATYIEGGELMVSGEEFLSSLIGIYGETDERCEIADVTVLYFLRAVPATGIGDFALYSPMDEIECYVAGDWFTYCNLYSEGEFMYSFLVAKDFSVIIDMSYPQGEVIYGSLDNTLNATHTYEIYDENDELVTVEEPHVMPIVYGGTTMAVGTSEEVFIAAPYDLTRSVTIVSDNTDVVTVDGTAITALSPGKATLTVTADYCGTVKDFKLEIEVVENSFADSYDDDEFSDSEFTDPKYATYYDLTSMRATMELCCEDGLISVDILWADDAYTEHHWSYIGPDDATEGVYYVNGRYTIDTYSDDGSFSEEVIAEDITATITMADDGYIYWYDNFEETDHDCVFELPEF